MNPFRFIVPSFLILCTASGLFANIGQKGREKHHEMNDAVVEHRASVTEAKAEAEAKGVDYIEKCPDLVIKKGKRTIVIKCGDAKRDNPDCPVCGVKK